MKKKLLAFAMVFAMAAVAIVGGTLAYFTDSEAKDNVFTVGNVSVELNEYQLGENGTEVLFEESNDKLLMPGAQNAKDKIVRVTNDGNQAAYIRVRVAVPTVTVDKNVYDVVHIINETDKVTKEKDSSNGEPWYLDSESNLVTDPNTQIQYREYTYYYRGILAADATTDNVIKAVYLDESIDCNVIDVENDGEIERQVTYTFGDTALNLNPTNVTVKVAVDAIQSAGFANYDEAFAEFN